MARPDPAVVPVTTLWTTKTGPNALNNPLTNEPLEGTPVQIRVIEGNKGLYKEVWRQDGNTTTIICDVAWEDRSKFLKEMLGFTLTENVGQGVKRLLRYLPERNPEQPYQYCIHCELIDDYANHRQSSIGPHWPKYDRAVYICVFQSVPYLLTANPSAVNGVPPFVDESTRYVFWRRRWVTREQKVPGGGFKLTDGSGKALGEVGFRPSTEIEWECTWYQIPVDAVPATAIEETAGHTNNAVFTIDGKPKAIETVLFKGAQEKKYYTPAGDFVCDLTYLFGVRAETWNKFPDQRGNMVLVTHDGTPGGEKLYKTKPFGDLFKPE